MSVHHVEVDFVADHDAVKDHLAGQRTAFVTIEADDELDAMRSAAWMSLAQGRFVTDTRLVL